MTRPAVWLWHRREECAATVILVWAAVAAVGGRWGEAIFALVGGIGFLCIRLLCLVSDELDLVIRVLQNDRSRRQ